MTAHDDLLEAVAALALGVLPESEARAVASHVEACAECRAEYADLRPAADAVGYGAELETLDEVTSARLRGNVMRVVRAGGGAGSAGPVLAPPAVARISSGARTAYLAAAAAAVLAVAALANAFATHEAGRREADTIAQLQARNGAIAARASELQARLDALTAPGSKHYAVSAGEVVASNGRLYFAIRVPPVAAGRVYQAWTLRANAHAMSPSVTFAPAAAGTTVIELPEPAKGLAAVALSVEPAGGSRAPTSRPTFVLTLS